MTYAAKPFLLVEPTGDVRTWNDVLRQLPFRIFDADVFCPEDGICLVRSSCALLTMFAVAGHPSHRFAGVRDCDFDGAAEAAASKWGHCSDWCYLGYRFRDLVVEVAFDGSIVIFLFLFARVIVLKIQRW